VTLPDIFAFRRLRADKMAVRAALELGAQQEQRVLLRRYKVPLFCLLSQPESLGKWGCRRNRDKRAGVEQLPGCRQFSAVATVSGTTPTDALYGYTSWFLSGVLQTGKFLCAGGNSGGANGGGGGAVMERFQVEAEEVRGQWRQRRQPSHLCFQYRGWRDGVINTNGGMADRRKRRFATIR